MVMGWGVNYHYYIADEGTASLCQRCFSRSSFFFFVGEALADVRCIPQYARLYLYVVIYLPRMAHLHAAAWGVVGKQTDAGVCMLGT